MSILTSKRLLVFAIVVFISSCCKRKYAKEDFEFSVEELEFFKPLAIGDTIYFESNLGDTDTITVIDYTIEKRDGKGCLMAPMPSNYKSINIKHLPVDFWHGTSTVISRDGTSSSSINYQSIFSISKFPTKKEVNYRVSFKNFYFDNFSLGKPKHQLGINDKVIKNCYKLSHNYPERVVNPVDIEFVYWTKKYGLMAYTNKAGETWCRVNK